MATETAIKVPDIGGATGVDVIELLVKVGDTVENDTPLLTLESDKASMEIPSPAAGVVRSFKVKLGDKVSEGDVILMLETDDQTSAPAPAPRSDAQEPTQQAHPDPVVEAQPIDVAAPVVEAAPAEKIEISNDASLIFTSPSVRRLARVLGVNLTEVSGSGPKSRITREDVEQFVQAKLSEKSVGLAMPSAPVIDFSRFGQVEVKPLNKIKRLTATNVHRSYVSIPHVTQFDEADITDLESFRKSESERLKEAGYKLTMLAFVTKVVSAALAQYPQFNASLDERGENLIMKQYCNIGIAVETPNGLVVPVIKAVNQLSVGGIAKEMARLSSKAREKGLMPNDMNGGCFTISSLGGIGGTAFTPIVNAPEVAILGLSRSSLKPIYDNGQFVPRLMLPLSLSYDHRVIDGAEAARFTRFISDNLQDIRRILL